MQFLKSCFCWDADRRIVKYGLYIFSFDVPFDKIEKVFPQDFERIERLDVRAIFYLPKANFLPMWKSN